MYIRPLSLLRMGAITILVLGVLVRFFSIQWNTIPHGDLLDDSRATLAFLQHGNFRVQEHDPESTMPGFYSTAKTGGEYLTNHPPLWHILSAGLTFLRGGEETLPEIYFSFKVLSFLSGLLTLFLAFFVTRRLLGETAALWLTIFLSISYLMIDYSGNGSFYMLHAALFLLWILIALGPPRLQRTLLLGAITGVAYLLNFQTVVLLPATLLVLLADTGISFRQKIQHVFLALALALALALPWFIRDALLFGDPFFSYATNQTYVFAKAGLQPLLREGILTYDIGWPERVLIFRKILATWLPGNLYYIARKLFILAPIAFIFFSFGLLDYLFSKERFRKMLPVLLLLILHILLAASWPVVKFRYFVPFLPLVFLIALEQLSSLSWSGRVKNAVLGATVIVMLVLSFLTYVSVPTHTYYYDGAITQDLFGGSEEMRFLEEHHLLPTP